MDRREQDTIEYLNNNQELIEGLFISNDRGFGFVEVEGMDEDFFIPENYKNGAFHHDTVLISIFPSSAGKRREAKVVKVVSHEITELVGYFQDNKSFGYVLPDNKKIAQDIYVAKNNKHGAINGHKVIVKITDYGQKGRKPEGEIVKILGHVSDPGVDILSVVHEYEIPSEFDEEVQYEAERIPDKVTEKISREEKISEMK